MGWDLVNKSSNAVIASSGNAGAVANDEYTDTTTFGVTAGARSEVILSGKKYFECTVFNDGSAAIDAVRIGVANSGWDETNTAGSNRIGASANVNAAWAFLLSGTQHQKSYNSVTANILTSGAQGDIFQIAFDATTKEVWFGQNNTWVGDPGAGTGAAYTCTGTDFTIAANLYSESNKGIRGFFNPATLTYTPPTGFSALESDPAVPVTPDNLTQTQTLGQPFVDNNNEVISPATLTQAATLGQPGLTASIASIAPDNLTQVATLAQPALSSTVPIAPAGVTQAQTLQIPSVSFTTPIAPDNVVQTQSLGIPVVAMNSRLFTGILSLPGLTASGNLLLGGDFQGVLELPYLTGEIYDGYQGDILLPPVVVEGSLLTGLIFTGDITLPALRAVATGAVPGDFGGTLSIPSLTASGTLLTGAAFEGDATLPGLTGAGTLLQSIGFTGTWTLPALEAEGTLLVGSLFAGSFELPALVAEGVFENTAPLAFFVSGMNVVNSFHGPRTNSDFLGLGRLGNDTFAAMSDGLYRLDGESDGDAGIEARFLLGFHDFGVEAVKGQRVAYLGLSADGPLELLVRTDTDGDTVRAYPVEDPHSTAAGAAPVRVKIGRGLKGRYWQMGLRNVGGADFELDRLGLPLWPTTRKR